MKKYMENATYSISRSLSFGFTQNCIMTGLKNLAALKGGSKDRMIRRAGVSLKSLTIATKSALYLVVLSGPYYHNLIR